MSAWVRAEVEAVAEALVREEAVARELEAGLVLAEAEVRAQEEEVRHNEDLHPHHG
jgi:hypothetical protein